VLAAPEQRAFTERDSAEHLAAAADQQIPLRRHVVRLITVARVTSFESRARARDQPRDRLLRDSSTSIAPRFSGR